MVGAPRQATPDASIVDPLRKAAAEYHLFPEFVADLREVLPLLVERVRAATGGAA